MASRFADSIAQAVKHKKAVEHTQEAFRAWQNCNWSHIEFLTAGGFVDCDLTMQDNSGCNMLHYACRVVTEVNHQAIKYLIANAPDLACQYSFATGAPKSWIPLHALCDAPFNKALEPVEFYQLQAAMIDDLFSVMDLSTILSKILSGMTAFRVSVPQCNQ